MQDTLKRWHSEKTAAYLSSAVAGVERDPTRAKLFRDMAASAEKQAGILAKDLKPAPAFTPSLRSRLTVLLLGVFGPRAVRQVLSDSKVRGGSGRCSNTRSPRRRTSSSAIPKRKRRSSL